MTSADLYKDNQTLNRLTSASVPKKFSCLYARSAMTVISGQECIEGGGGLYLTLHCYRQNDNEPVWPSGKALGW